MANREATEAPTEKRKRDGRKEGRIARSADLTSWWAVLVGMALVPTTAKRVSEVFSDGMAQFQSAGNIPLPSILGEALWRSLLAAAPILGGVWLASFVATIAQVGFVLSGKPLKPKAERLSPTKNVKRLVGVRGVVEVVKQIAKATVVVLLMWGVVIGISGSLVSSGSIEAMSGMAYVYGRLAGAVRSVAIAGIALAVLEYGYQKWQVMRDMRMTKQEIRDEYRQSEGDPLVKQRLRQLQREAARRRMLEDVQTATAVIVNPTHIAVALRYRPGVDLAPKIVAKGRGVMATKIREKALEGRVPIVRAVPLARALEKSCEIGDEVPTQLFEAVARVLAFLARVGRQVAWAGVLDLPAAWDTPVGDVARRRRRVRR